MKLARYLSPIVVGVMLAFALAAVIHAQSVSVVPAGSSSGGSSTVTTDGTTITGNGSVGSPIALATPVTASNGGNGTAYGAPAPFEVGTLSAISGEVAYAGNGSTLSFSGYTTAKLVSVDTNTVFGGGNVTVHWTHAATPNSSQVVAAGTFTANADLASGSITNAGALTLTFVAGHAPDNATNITIDYNQAVQCNFANTNSCHWTVNTIGKTYTVLDPLNLPTNGEVQFRVGNSAPGNVSNMSFGSIGSTKFLIPMESGSGYALTAYPSVNYAPAVQGCTVTTVANGIYTMKWTTDGTKLSLQPGTCAAGALAVSNFQMGAGDLFSDTYFHTRYLWNGSGVYTVATLPTCDSSHMGMTSVSDSTAITFQGQACAGSGAVEAVAMCDGVAWRCFASSPNPTNASNLTSGTVAAARGGTSDTLSSIAPTVNNLGSVSGAQTCSFTSARVCQMTATGSITLTMSNLPTSTFIWVVAGRNAANTGFNITWPSNAIAEVTSNGAEALGQMSNAWNSNAAAAGSGPLFAVYEFWSDGTNAYLVSPPNIIAASARFATASITASTGLLITGGGAGGLELQGGSVLSMTGGTAPTLTAGCNGAGSSVPSTSTDNRGEFISQTASATTCTLTFNHTWPQKPYCVCGDGNASTSPVACSFDFTSGSTTTAVFDFASTASRTWVYVCE